MNTKKTRVAFNTRMALLTDRCVMYERLVFYCGQCNRPWNRDVSASICIGDVARATCLQGLPPAPFRRAKRAN
jgi:hypothetical protein